MTPPPGQRSRSSEARRLAVILLSPTFIVLGLVILYPLMAAVYQSLFRREDSLDERGILIKEENFVGLDNYSSAFTGSAASRFWNAFYNTAFFTITTVLLEVVIGVAMALVMHHAFRGRGIVRASILVPWAVPTAVSAIMWKWIFDSKGVANSIIGRQILWTTEGWQAKFAVIIADVWKTAPFVGLLTLAGLQLIPKDTYEAAKVDGASAVRQFWQITLPLVRPVLLVAVLFRLLDALRMFDLPFIMIGPRKSSVETLSMLAFEEATQSRYGPAAAYATLLFVFIALAAYAFVKLLGTDLIGEAKERGQLTPRLLRRKQRNAAGEAAAR